MLVICWVNTHTEIPSCRALKPRLTSCPVRPLTSFDAAQSSSMKQGVGAREEVAGHPQPVLDLVLQAHDHIDVRVAIHEAFVGLVLDKGGAEEHDVVKLAPEGASQLVQKILCLTDSNNACTFFHCYRAFALFRIAVVKSTASHCSPAYCDRKLVDV